MAVRICPNSSCSSRAIDVWTSSCSFSMRHESARSWPESVRTSSNARRVAAMLSTPATATAAARITISQ